MSIPSLMTIRRWFKSYDKYTVGTNDLTLCQIWQYAGMTAKHDRPKKIAGQAKSVTLFMDM
jgi:hypothetical protein